jgi:nitronate monooxygenase
MPDHFLGRLAVDVPIFQAPIGSIASPELAAAVSNAGGIGHLACTWRTPDQLVELFRTVRRLTAKPYGANFVLDFPIEERLAVALEAKVPVISFFWGDASRYVSRVHDAGALAIQIVGSIRDAVRAAEAGFDLIVAQGREAGGHVCGQLGLMALLPQVVDAVAPLPVIAAGGIADRRGVEAACALGAAGVWVGTRFLSASEANIHDVYRDRVLACSGDDVVYSELFDNGWPRAPLHSLQNSTIELWRSAGCPSSPQRPRENEIVARRGDGSNIPRYHFGSPTRDVSGQVEAMALYAGEAVGLVRSRQPAAAIVGELAAGLRKSD